MKKDLDYLFRMFEDNLTDEERAEEKRIAERDKNRKRTDNQYAACGMYEDELELSLDTH